jgi:multiple sugar transport system substrate-binding protein
MTKLRGMTWSHPRGFDPMLATANAWQEQTGVEIAWDKRSLQDFESFPVEELARAYDLIVIDHPHVGQITAEHCLLPLDVPGREAEAAALAAGSVGQSYPSYNWQGRQWALPIDAAAQVMAYRADLLPEPPSDWEAVLGLARAGRVTVPLRTPHSLMLVYTLMAGLGQPCPSTGPDPLLVGETARTAIERLRELVALLEPEDFSRDPIEASEQLAASDGKLAVMPYGYGYANYAADGFRAHALRFADIPAVAGLGPTGSVLGGTGIAVSAFSAKPEAAIAYAYWVASAETQRGLYAAAGGQPGHAAAWDADSVNRPTHDFYRGTRRTLELAYVRPRHNGYMAFQQAAADRLGECLRARASATSIIADLNRLFEASR